MRRHIGPSVPSEVGPYRIVGRWKETRLGTIHAARRVDTGTERVWALLALGTESRAIHEALCALVRRMSCVVDPRIACPLDVASEDDATWIAAPFVAGESLRKVVSATGPLPRLVAIAVAREVAAIMGRARASVLPPATSTELLHSDIRASNVVLAHESGPIVLLEFGILDAMFEGGVVLPPGEREERVALGLVRDDHDEISAIGLLLFELVTGQRPFDALDRQKGAAGKLPQASHFVRCGKEVDDIVLRAVSRDRSDTFESLVALERALERYIDERGKRFDLPRELDAILHQRFRHRASAMETLLRRWKAAPIVSNRPRRRSAPGRQASELASVTQDLEVHALAVDPSTRSRAEAALAEPIDFVAPEGSTTTGAMRALPTGPRDGAPTDDLAASRTGDLPMPRRGGFFVRTLVVLLIVANLFGIAALYFGTDHGGAVLREIRAIVSRALRP